MKFILILLFSGLLSFPHKTSEAIDLYDSSGNANVFIEKYITDLVVYSWDGKPLAYLHQGFSSTDVYGFNGKHLGWFEDGMLRDNQGYIIAATKQAINKIVGGEPMKGLKASLPDKKFREPEPPKPYFGILWSSIPATAYLLSGIDK